MAVGAVAVRAQGPVWSEIPQALVWVWVLAWGRGWAKVRGWR